MVKRHIELWDSIDGHDAERAASLLANPTSKKLTQCLNGYRAATSTKKRRRRTALLCAICLIENEIGTSEILRAINFMTEGTDLTGGEVDEEFAKELAAVIKTDDRGKAIMRQIVKSISAGNSIEDVKLVKKFEIRISILDHKPKADLPFSIQWY